MRINRGSRMWKEYYINISSYKFIATSITFICKIYFCSLNMFHSFLITDDMINRFFKSGRDQGKFISSGNQISLKSKWIIRLSRGHEVHVLWYISITLVHGVKKVNMLKHHDGQCICVAGKKKKIDIWFRPYLQV